MTTRKGILIELLEPVITSTATATGATPRALPYIPGAMLWGIAAAKGYACLSKVDAYTQFHSGALRFGDGLPAQALGAGLPVPMSIHLKKAADAGNWATEGVDYAVADRMSGYEQQRGFAVAAGGGVVKVKRSLTMRTAINPDTGRAEDQKLFAFEALAAGQMFLAVIEGGDQALVDQALDTLCGDAGKEHLLGRSRTAEFGRVKMTRAEPWQINAPESGLACYLWCLSDVAAVDADGQPSERPDDFFGAVIDWSRSFTRHRRYAPWNGHWPARAPEHLVIERGSVITLKTGIPPGLQRIGMYQEIGLGVVFASVQPPLALAKGYVGSAVAGTKAPETGGQTDLSKWLTVQKDERAAKLKSAKSAAEQVEDWMGYYRQAAELNGKKVGPTQSQWGQIGGSDDVARDLKDWASDDPKIAGREVNIWQARIKEGQPNEGTFVAFAQAYLKDQGDRGFKVFAQLMRRRLEAEGWFHGK